MDERGHPKWKGRRRVAALLVLLCAIPYPLYVLISRRADAQRRSHADFDAACAWIAHKARRDGPVLTRHPGEVFWQTGRLAALPAADDLDGLVRQIRDQEIAYVLVDADRLANAAPDARCPGSSPSGRGWSGGSSRGRSRWTR